MMANAVTKTVRRTRIIESSPPFTSLRLSVNFPQNDIDAAQDRNTVRNLPAPHHIRNSLQVDERRGTQVEPVGVCGPIAHQKRAQGSAWRFNLGVVFSCRRPDGLWHFPDDLALRQLVEGLLQDVQA